MALSRQADQIMGQLAEAYVAAGFPPIAEWWFQMPQAIADDLDGAGYIELVDVNQWRLTPSGHQWIMNRGKG